MKLDYEDLLKHFRMAASHVPKEYFQLPVMGVEEPIYRERVYCYELYHHLRKAWPQSLALYSLSGEIEEGSPPHPR